MRMTMKLRVAATVVSAAGLAAGVGVLSAGSAVASATTSTAARPAAAHGSADAAGLRVRVVQVPVSSLSPQLRAIVHKDDPTAIALAAWELQNYQPINLLHEQYCLDANTAGSTAGKNGDKIQIWNCYNDIASHPNQWWIPLQDDQNPEAKYTTLVNDQYQSECLNADNTGGLANGQPVQLWSCSVNTANEYWDWNDLINGTSTPDGSNPLSLEAGSGYVLDAQMDATHTPAENGDKVQIWQSLGNLNQDWYPFS